MSTERVREWIADRLRGLADWIDWRIVAHEASYIQGYHDAQAEEYEHMRDQPTERDVYDAWRAGTQGERW